MITLTAFNQCADQFKKKYGRAPKRALLSPRTNLDGQPEIEVEWVDWAPIDMILFEYEERVYAAYYPATNGNSGQGSNRRRASKGTKDQLPGDNPEGDRRRPRA